jgi:uncharacterized membrane protein
MWHKLQRILRHRWLADEATERAIPAAVLSRLAERVKLSETKHSGEIRIYVEAGLPLSYLWRSEDVAAITRQRALAMFGKLRVWDTADNNGVLIYLLLAEQRIEVVADRGVNERVPANTWAALVQSMGVAFKAGDFELGLTQAVEAVSSQLQAHFPLAAGQTNTNELPDQPVLG